MRRNQFGEAYCSTAAEVSRMLEEAEVEPDEVYASIILVDPGEEPAAEIARNDDGETVCFVECSTEANVRSVLYKAGVECLG